MISDAYYLYENFLPVKATVVQHKCFYVLRHLKLLLDLRGILGTYCCIADCRNMATICCQVVINCGQVKNVAICSAHSHKSKVGHSYRLKRHADPISCACYGDSRHVFMMQLKFNKCLEASWLPLDICRIVANYSSLNDVEKSHGITTF
jgi:hypothetical protein